ncbi:hypothetical protein [Desulfitibacter alkalitolerans]|uniref:hypothetical protein n=1 Tax=Desulfitibacter alkalitolerans TaxID=264641 RepID=UPI0004820077|nr:hypothetical protein [Desulfitibacter alkalitolerans]
MRRINFFLVYFVAAFIVSTSFMVTFASGTEGPKRYFTVYSIDYHNQSSLRLTWNNGLQARTIIMHVDNVNLPSGYMGVFPRLYNDNGVVVSEPLAWVYNNSPAVGLEAPAPTYTQKGAYYSHGLTRAYNGNGYTQHSTYRSPSLNIN